MTVLGSLLTYIQGEWTETTPTAAQVKWNEDWFDTKELMYPQVIVKGGWNIQHEYYKTSGSTDMRIAPRYLVNVGHFVKTGSPGTLELTRTENMVREIRRIMLEGLNITPQYGGSLGPLRIAVPRGSDTPLHDSRVEPALLRYEMTLECTEDVE